MLMLYGVQTINLTFAGKKVRDDPKLVGDSGEVPISKWSGW